MSSTYLVTGANRGLGYALVASLVQQPRTNVIATVRSTESTAALDSLDVHESSNIVQVIVAFDSKTDATTLSAISSLPETYPWLIHIDTVIANASISTSPSRAIDTPASALRDHLAINAVAPAALFQATWPLLKLAPCPRFVVLSSMVGSIHDVPKTSAYASVAYGMSKAALNYWIRKIGAEHEDLAVMAIHPGWVQTDMGNASAVKQGLEKAPIKVSDAVEGILVEMEQMERGKDSGFRTFDHKEIPW